MEKMMTVKDIARVLGVPASRVYDRWHKWGMPMYRVGQQLRCDPVDFKEWLNGRRVT